MTRMIAAALGLTALAAPIAPGLAGGQEAPDGRGSASSVASLLHVSLGGDGGLLDLSVLVDDSSATTDGVPEASSILTALAADAPGDALDIVVAPVEVRSTGGEQTQGAEALSLSNPAVSGSISPATLTANVDAAGARTTVQSALANLSLAGALLNVDAVSAGVTADVAASRSEATRGLTVDSLVALDLGALLDGLGLSLADLPVPALVDLLDSLGQQVPGVTDVGGAITALNTAIDELQAETGNLTGTVCTEVDGVLTGGGLPGIGEVLPGGVTCTTVDTVTQPLTDTIDALQTELAGVLGALLQTLDGAALLSLDAVNVGLAATSTGAVDTSSASVQASIGDLTIGGQVVPGIDLTASVDQVAALANTVTGEVSGVLGSIHPELGTLVDVSLLERTSNVAQDGDFVVADAGLTVARVTITPPATLSQIVSTVLASGESVTDAITGLGGTVPQLSTAMSTLEQALGGTVQALTQPSTVVLGSLTARASHAVAAPAPAAPGAPAQPEGELPRTGPAAAATAFLGVVLAGTALGIRRWLRSTSQHTS